MVTHRQYRSVAVPLLLHHFPVKLFVETFCDTLNTLGRGNIHSFRKGRMTLASHDPSLGEVFDPLHIQVELPYAFYARLRQEEPITFSPTINAYLVSRYEDIRSILAQPDLFSSKNALGFPVQFHPQTIAELRKGYPYAVPTLTDDGARHTRMRKPFEKAFSPIRVRAMEPFIREVATKADRWFYQRWAGRDHFTVRLFASSRSYPHHSWSSATGSGNGQKAERCFSLR